MRPIVALRLRTVCAVLSVAASAACVSSSVSPHPPAGAPRQPAPAVEPPAPDASYDWHVLLLVPFGTLLKDSPLALHEVLLFHDPAHDTGRSEDQDCYAIDGASPPQFVGRRPDDYLLCFGQDRLNRIEASVRLPADGAGAIFAAACALWLKNGSPPSSTAGSCEGRDGAIGFSARLGGEPAAGATAPSAQSAQSAMTLSISLFSVTDP